jgi:hypothetical protein
VGFEIDKIMVLSKNKRGSKMIDPCQKYSAYAVDLHYSILLFVPMRADTNQG